VAVLLLPLALLLVALGCARDSTRSEDEPGTVTIMMPIDEYGLSWHWSTQAQFLVFSPLVARNAQGELEPRLAASWEHSPDYREWTVRLNTTARWHDGVPVTADDVAFTLELLQRESVVAGVEAAYGVTVLDDSTYAIRYERPAAGSPFDDYTVIYPKHLLDGLDPEGWGEWEFWKQPRGGHRLRVRGQRRLLPWASPHRPRGPALRRAPAPAPAER
jgi:ABC-type transport system substrate-binding protein